MKGDDIACRLLLFSVNVLKPFVRSGAIPPGDTLAGSYCALRLLAVRTTRDRDPRKVVLISRELREARYWLRLVSEANLGATSGVNHLVNEAGELIAILTTSAKTAKARR